jgi:hypothetical protein
MLSRRTASPLPPDEEQCHDNIIAFLAAGPYRQLPASVAVNALASDRRAVAAQVARGASIGGRLASEVRIPGVMESAAVLAVMEIPEH